MAGLLGTGAFWRVYAATYDLLWADAFTALVARSVVDVVTAVAPAPRPVLEVGAGTGLVTEALIETGYLVWASEPVPAMRRRFARRLPQVPVHAARIDQLLAAADLPAPEGRGRTIVAVNVLHLTADPAVALEMLRTLAGCGSVVVATPSPGLTIAGLVAAKRRAGVSGWRIARFLATQAALIPVITALGPRTGTDRDLTGLFDQAPVLTVEGCVDIYRLCGQDDERGAMAASAGSEPGPGRS